MNKNQTFLKITLGSFLIYFLSWFFVYNLGINKLAIQSEDTLPAMFLPVTIIKEHTLYLDTYYNMLKLKYPHPDDKSYIKGLTPFYLKQVGEHYASAFPIISGLLAVPVYFLPVTFGIAITWDNLIFLSHISSSLIMAFSGGFFYLLVLKLLRDKDNKKALLLTAVYLFGNINFALISQALWQHGTLQLFLILGLSFLAPLFLNGVPTKTATFFGGLSFGFSILSRPTATLAFCFIVLYFLLRNPKRLSTFFLGMIPVLLFFFWYNNTYYISLSNQGYATQLLDSWLSPFPQSFIGVWISPSKGILTYSPVFFFSLVGFYSSIKSLNFTNLKKLITSINPYLIFGLIAVIHTLIISFWKHWYGGWSFGYRMSSDVIPFFVLMLIPFVTSTFFDRYKKIFLIFLGLSLGMQLFGVVFFDGIWHAAYDKGFRNTSWLWSIRDSEMFFNVRRVLVKLHLLNQACPKCLPN